MASRHCEVNILTRWGIAFGQGLALYIPVRIQGTELLRMLIIALLDARSTSCHSFLQDPAYQHRQELHCTVLHSGQLGLLHF